MNYLLAYKIWKQNGKVPWSRGINENKRREKCIQTDRVIWESRIMGTYKHSLHSNLTPDEYNIMKDIKLKEQNEKAK